MLPLPQLKPALHTCIVLISSPLRLGPNMLQCFPYVSKKPRVSINIKRRDINLLDVYNFEVALDFLGYVLDILSVRHR